MHQFALVVFKSPKEPTFHEAEAAVERLMDPFIESGTGECNPSYIEFVSTQDEVEEKFNKPVTEYYWKSTPAESPKEGEPLFLARQAYTAPHPEWKGKKFSEVFENIGDFARDYFGYEQDAKTGEFGYYNNPNGRWDWWQLGGRWTGTLDGYDPSKNPSNQKQCTYCHPTGIRTDMLSQRKSSVPGQSMEERLAALTERLGTGEPLTAEEIQRDWKEFACNGCNGTGIAEKWPTEWAKHSGDIQPVGNVLAFLEGGGTTPCSLLTPDGEWYEHPWDSFTPPPHLADEWRKQCLEVLKQFPDCWVAVVDYHS